jgi:hypothetical protein
MSQLVSEHYWCNTEHEKHVACWLEVHIRVVVVLTGVKLTVIYFLHLLYIFYYSVTTHIRKGKKVSILPLGDVSLGSIPSKRGLLQDSPYPAVGVACPLCD